MNLLNRAEAAIVRSINEALSCPALDFLMPAVSFLADKGWFFILIAAVLCMFKKTRRCGMNIIVSLIIGLVLANVIQKPLFARIRPYDFDLDIQPIIEPMRDFSFPSGHSLAAAEAAVSVFLYNRKWGGVLLVLALLIAFSRVYLMVHYPTDVIAGFALGIITALIGRYIVKSIPNCEKLPE